MGISYPAIIKLVVTECIGILQWMEAGVIGMSGIIGRGKEHVVVPILNHHQEGSDVLGSG